MKAEGIIKWDGKSYAVIPAFSPLLGIDLGQIAFAGSHIGKISEGPFQGWLVYKVGKRNPSLVISTVLPNTQVLTARRLLELP